jgi:hypothetical protein
MGDSFASTAAAEAETVGAEKRRAAAEATASVEGLETQARMKAELEQQLRRAEEAAKLRTEQEAAGASRRQAAPDDCVVALMVLAPLKQAIKLAMALQPMLETAETLRARADRLTGVQRFDFISVKPSPLARAGLEAKEKYTWCEMDGMKSRVKYRFEPAQRRPAGVSRAEGPRAASALAPAPARKGPRPQLYRWGEEDKTGQGYTGNTWVGGTSYAKVGVRAL